MKPYTHAENSAKKWGGKPEDYLTIHEFLDSSKSHIADHRHRCILHNSFGCFIVEKVFGSVLKNSDGNQFFPRDVAEQHIIEDLGHIPTVQDWLNDLPVKEWHGGGNKETIPSRSGIAAYAAAKKAAARVLDEVAKKYPAALEAIFESSTYNCAYWRQYTPYFNDGEPCQFNVFDILVSKMDKQVIDKIDDVWDNDGIRDEEGNDVWDYLERNWDSSPKEMVELNAEIGKIWDKELLESAFGDHKKIKWRRGKGFEVEEYDHD